MEETQHDHDLSDEAREQLREAVKTIQDATFDVLVNKPTREVSFFVHVAAEDGSSQPRRIRYKAISPKALDELQVAHPPSTKEERKGAAWNKDTFPPALIAAVSLVPKLSEEQAREIFTADN